MKIKRTANAGVLLELDGVSVLLDGVCGEVKPYIPTPALEAEALRRNWPDMVAFTHAHTDHFDLSYAQDYQEKTFRPILGPESFPLETCDSQKVKDVLVQSLPVRHLGRAEDVPHVSFLIKGSKTVLFTGDASPLQWQKMALPKIDVLIGTYAYATSRTGWHTVRELAPETVVLLHFPLRENDPAGLWDSALKTVTESPVGTVYIPHMGQTVTV